LTRPDQPATLSYTSDGTLTCQYGDVDDFPDTVMHQPDPTRPCVHLIGPMPRIFLVRRKVVDQLNFQPRIMSTHGQRAIIAARTDNILTLSVDLIGPLDVRHPHRGTKNRDNRVFNHWQFTLNEIDDAAAYAHRPRLIAVGKFSPANPPPCP